MNLRFFIYILLITLSKISAAQDETMSSCTYDCCRPDGHAPAAIMTDHVHGKSRFNFGYMSMYSRMNGNMQGNQTLSTTDVLRTYAIAPTQMDMQMHMFMAGYGINGKTTLMGMMQWMKNDMSMQLHPSLVGMSMPGMDMTSYASTMKMSSSGLGDSRLYLLGVLKENHTFRLIGSLGLNMPTGSITQRMTPMWKSGNSIMSYCMQNGTGSWGLLPAITFIKQSGSFSFGFVGSGEYWLAENSRNYRTSQSVSATLWAAYQIQPWISCSIRPDWKYTGKISGFDANIVYASFNDPTANTINYGGQIARTAFGLNFYVPEGKCRELRLSAEYVIPFYQALNGTQMKSTQGLNLALQYTFMK